MKMWRAVQIIGLAILVAGLAGLIVISTYQIAWYKGYGSGEFSGHLEAANADWQVAKAMQKGHSRPALLLLYVAMAKHLDAIQGMEDNSSPIEKFLYQNEFPRLRSDFLTATDAVVNGKDFIGADPQIKSIILSMRTRLHATETHAK